MRVLKIPQSDSVSESGISFTPRNRARLTKYQDELLKKHLNLLNGFLRIWMFVCFAKGQSFRVVVFLFLSELVTNKSFLKNQTALFLHPTWVLHFALATPNALRRDS